MDGIIESPEGYLTRNPVAFQTFTNFQQPFSLGTNSI